MKRIQKNKNHFRVLNTKPNVEVASVAEMISVDIDHDNLLVQATHEQTFMQKLSMTGTKCQRMFIILSAPIVLDRIIELAFS